MKPHDKNQEATIGDDCVENGCIKHVYQSREKVDLEPLLCINTTKAYYYALCSTLPNDLRLAEYYHTLQNAWDVINIKIAVMKIPSVFLKRAFLAVICNPRCDGSCISLWTMYPYSSICQTVFMWPSVWRHTICVTCWCMLSLSSQEFINSRIDFRRVFWLLWGKIWGPNMF